MERSERGNVSSSSELKITVTFRPAALVEFNESADWYEARQLGLGEKFVSSIDTAVAVIVATPKRAPTVYKQVRLISVKGFPYQIYYRLLGEDLIEILAVFHVRQNPKIWQSRS